MNDAEKKVSKFYNNLGWETNNGITEDAKRFEDLRECSRDYISKCRLRILRHISKSGDKILDMASGPLQYKEYLQYSKNYNKRYCVDLSLSALDDARKKIGDHGIFLHGSFFDIPLEENLFDCAISLHTIYHIDKNKQEEAVRKLIRVTKPKKTIVIIYSNSSRIYKWGSRLIISPFIFFKKLKKTLKKLINKSEKEKNLDLYFYTHPMEWWNRFGDVTTSIEILPWRSIHSDLQKCLIPNNIIGKKILALLFYLEESFPKFFSKYFCYHMIILTKK